MTTLDLDVGNSRLKWRLSEVAHGVVLESAEPRAGEPSLVELSGDTIASEVARIRVSSVAGREWNQNLARHLETRFGVVAEFARSGQPDIVACGYADPTLLGVDRWLAVLGAWQRGHSDVVVIDCGTAVTVDFVLRPGRHLGGYIVPGMTLMVDALLLQTADVKTPKARTMAPPVEVTPGTSTAEAVQRGVVRMLADFIDANVVRFQDQCDDRAHVYVCGGDADIITPHMTTSADAVPGLVFDGLAVALP
jgi:type III pantothenate kinase